MMTHALAFLPAKLLLEDSELLRAKFNPHPNRYGTAPCCTLHLSAAQLERPPGPDGRGQTGYVQGLQLHWLGARLVTPTLVPTLAPALSGLMGRLRHARLRNTTQGQGWQHWLALPLAPHHGPFTLELETAQGDELVLSAQSLVLEWPPDAQFTPRLAC